jgi:ComF family protein
MLDFLNLLFPKTCLSCGRWGKYICDSCNSRFRPILKDGCVYCDRISFYGKTHDKCCRKDEIDGFMAVWYLNFTLYEIIKKIKYKLITDSFKELYYLIVNNCWDSKFTNFSKDFSNFYIQPIPLHKDRYLKRGFNQSKFIGVIFSKITGYPLIDVLSRIKKTDSQARSSSRMARYFNIKKAFYVKDKQKVKGKNIILVDDIYTTGNTVKEACRTLKKAGAKKVFVFTLARG